MCNELFPFFTPTKSSCEFSFEVSQDDVGAEDADDAEAGFLKQTLTDGTRKTGSPFSMINVQKSSNTIFKHIPRKDRFFGSVLSHTNESSGSISSGSVFSSKFEARNRPFYDLVKESMVAHVDSGKTNLDDFECWLRQFHSERDDSGRGFGEFFLERMLFSFPQGKERYTWFPKKNNVHENGDESCRWITLKMNVFFLVTMPSSTFFWHTADPLASW